MCDGGGEGIYRYRLYRNKLELSWLLTSDLYRKITYIARGRKGEEQPSASRS